MTRRNWSITLLILAMTIFTVTAYWPVARHGFVYDDVQYITGNEHLRGGLSSANIVWAFTTMYAANWHPVTWLSHLLDVELYGLVPLGHHLTSLLLHLMNGILLFTLLRGLTGSGLKSAAVTGLFLMHPLHVESVAWVAERKDVLSTFLGLLTLHAYARFARRGGWGNYLAINGLFALGLMAKPMLVSLPLVFLLLDYWPLRRSGWRRLLLEKAPLAVLTVLSSWTTYVAQAKEYALQPLEAYPLLIRLGNAAVSYLSYLVQGFWPAGLAVFYPHPGRELSLWVAVTAAAALLGATATAVWSWRRPYVAMGWLWYLGTLVPVIGIVQVGAQARADRYTYLPLVGICMAAVWRLADTETAKRRPAMTLGPAIGVVLLCFCTMTRMQVGHWRSDRSLFEHALEVGPENWLAHNNLAGAYSKERRTDLAAYHYRKASALNPRLRTEALFQRGEEFFSRWQFREAVGLYKEALRLNPEYREALMKLGLAYSILGEKDEAVAQYLLLRELDASMAQELRRYLGEIPN